MSDLLVVLTTLGVCALSAVVPFVNAELYLLGASALAPRRLVIPLIVAGAVGQMIGKIVMYLAGRGAVHLPSARLRRMVEAVRVRYATKSAVGDATIFASASLGFPPFYVVSVAAGMLRIALWRFAAVGLAGRLIRFAVIVIAPQLVQRGG